MFRVVIPFFNSNFSLRSTLETKTRVSESERISRKAYKINRAIVNLDIIYNRDRDYQPLADRKMRIDRRKKKKEADKSAALSSVIAKFIRTAGGIRIIYNGRGMCVETRGRALAISRYARNGVRAIESSRRSTDDSNGAAKGSRRGGKRRLLA